MRVILTRGRCYGGVVGGVSPARDAQGTTSTNRPAGTSSSMAFSITTGVGSSATVTTHKVEPGPPRAGSSSSRYQSLPDDDPQGKPDSGKLDRIKPVDTGASFSAGSRFRTKRDRT